MTQTDIAAVTVYTQQSPELMSKARALLAKAQTLDEVLHVRTMAQAARQYFKAAGHSREIAQEAAEIRLRAERKAGEVLIQMGEKGERRREGGDQRSGCAVQPVRLPDLGIEKTQSHRWQEIARVPEARFESYIEERKKRPLDELTTTGLMNEAKLAQKHALSELIRNEPQPLPDGPFRVIVADPPWPYPTGSDDATRRGRCPYPVMTLEAICSLPVGARAVDDAILWLWTTNAFLRDAFTVLDAWGFEHKTMLTWVKNQMGTGDWLRGMTEHCLLAIKGRPLVTLTNQTTALVADRGKHSAKPEEFYALVESLCPGSKLEMFARSQRKGWIVWGAESKQVR